MSSTREDDEAKPSIDGDATSDSEITTESTGSITELLSLPRTKRQLKLIVGTYAIIGLGFGLLSLLIDNQILGGEEGLGSTMIMGLIFIVIFVFVVFSGPIIGAVIGIEVANDIPDTRQALLASAVGNWAGYIVMNVVAILFTSSVLTGGSSGDGTTSGASGGELFNLSDLLFPLLIIAIATAVVGAAVTYAHKSVTQ